MTKITVEKRRKILYFCNQIFPNSRKYIYGFTSKQHYSLSVITLAAFILFISSSSLPYYFPLISIHFYQSIYLYLSYLSVYLGKILCFVLWFKISKIETNVKLSESNFTLLCIFILTQNEVDRSNRERGKLGEPEREREEKGGRGGEYYYSYCPNS